MYNYVIHSTIFVFFYILNMSLKRVEKMGKLEQKTRYEDILMNSFVKHQHFPTHSPATLLEKNGEKKPYRVSIKSSFHTSDLKFYRQIKKTCWKLEETLT